MGQHTAGWPICVNWERDSRTLKCFIVIIQFLGIHFILSPPSSPIAPCFICCFNQQFFFADPGENRKGQVIIGLTFMKCEGNIYVHLGHHIVIWSADFIPLNVSDLSIVIPVERMARSFFNPQYLGMRLFNQINMFLIFIFDESEWNQMNGHKTYIFGLWLQNITKKKIE
jgi:hypothetical protein